MIIMMTSKSWKKRWGWTWTFETKAVTSDQSHLNPTMKLKFGAALTWLSVRVWLCVGKYGEMQVQVNLSLRHTLIHTTAICVLSLGIIIKGGKKRLVTWLCIHFFVMMRSWCRSFEKGNRGEGKRKNVAVNRKPRIIIISSKANATQQHNIISSRSLKSSTTTTPPSPTAKPAKSYTTTTTATYTGFCM